MVVGIDYYDDLRRNAKEAWDKGRDAKEDWDDVYRKVLEVTSCLVVLSWFQKLKVIALSKARKRVDTFKMRWRFVI